jgi:hypothetical protein
VDTLRLDHAPLGLKFGHPLIQFLHNRIDSLCPTLRLNNIVALRINRKARILLFHGPKEWVNLAEGLDLIPEELNPVSQLIVSGIDFDHIAAHPERAAPKVCVIALVKNLNQAAGNVLAADALSLFKQQQHSVISLRRPQAVDAAHRADNDCVATFKEASRG